VSSTSASSAARLRDLAVSRAIIQPVTIVADALVDHRSQELDQSGALADPSLDTRDRARGAIGSLE
jgi:hypothetical protein